MTHVDYTGVDGERRWFPTVSAFHEWIEFKEAGFAPKPAPLDDNWMRVAPGTDAAIWRPWSRETGEL